MQQFSKKFYINAVWNKCVFQWDEHCKAKARLYPSPAELFLHSLVLWFHQHCKLQVLYCVFMTTEDLLKNIILEWVQRDVLEWKHEAKLSPKNSDSWDVLCPEAGFPAPWSGCGTSALPFPQRTSHNHPQTVYLLTTRADRTSTQTSNLSLTHSFLYSILVRIMGHEAAIHPDEKPVHHGTSELPELKCLLQRQQHAHD